MGQFSLGEFSSGELTPGKFDAGEFSAGGFSGHLEKIVFRNKFYIIFHFLPLRVLISIQSTGRSIP